MILVGLTMTWKNDDFLIPIAAYVVSCPTCRKNLEWYLTFINKSLFSHIMHQGFLGRFGQLFHYQNRLFSVFCSFDHIILVLSLFIWFFFAANIRIYERFLGFSSSALKVRLVHYVQWSYIIWKSIKCTTKNNNCQILDIRCLLFRPSYGSTKNQSFRWFMPIPSVSSKTFW